MRALALVFLAGCYSPDLEVCGGEHFCDPECPPAESIQYTCEYAVALRQLLLGETWEELV